MTQVRPEERHLYTDLPGVPWEVLPPSFDVASGDADTTVRWILMPDGKRTTQDDYTIQSRQLELAVRVSKEAQEERKV